MCIRDRVGYCVEVQANGYGGVLTAVVGVNTNGEVTGVAVTDHRETVGVGTVSYTHLPGPLRRRCTWSGE